MAENEAIKEFNKMVGNRMKTQRGISQKQHELFQLAMDSLEEIQQYRAIGTVEECREAREKQRAKKPYLYGGTRQGLDNDGNSISKEENCYECPACDQFLGYEIDCKDEHYQVDYCPYCGQALSWERDDE